MVRRNSFASANGPPGPSTHARKWSGPRKTSALVNAPSVEKLRCDVARQVHITSTWTWCRELRMMTLMMYVKSPFKCFTCEKCMCYRSLYFVLCSCPVYVNQMSIAWAKTWMWHFGLILQGAPTHRYAWFYCRQQPAPWSIWSIQNSWSHTALFPHLSSCSTVPHSVLVSSTLT